MKQILGLVCASFVLVSTSLFGAGARRFPAGPDPELTPGKLCDRPDSYRYPEHIPYCTRSVSHGAKIAVIQTYDDTRGFQIQATGRANFKIDHYIPLCMGGSNDKSNIWPQHRSVYEQTDPMEGLACEKMADGVLKQSRAVELIREAKNDLSRVPAIMSYLRSL
jgi:hypothetical protein